MSLAASVLNRLLRWVEKPALRRATEPLPIRRRFERNARLLFHAPRGTQQQWQVLEHGGRRVDVLDVVPGSLSSESVIYYIHGGGFLFGSPRTHAAMVAQLGKRLQARAVMPRYRLAPEHPFPAALDDVLTGYLGLIASGVPATRVVIGGDSAGGALTLSLLHVLLAEDHPLPGAAFCFSPLTDLTFSGESFRTNTEAEVILPAQKAELMCEMYLAGQDAHDPRVSPLFGTFTGAPPVWLTVGDTEILRDDSRRMAERLEADGVASTFIETQDLPHVWPIFHNVLPEGRETLDDLARWIEGRSAGHR